MKLNLIKTFFVAFFLFMIGLNVSAQRSLGERHLEVSLRMIGHEFLLSHGDSTSRVLPIEKVKDRYKISFDTVFEFRSQELVNVVNRVVEKTGISNKYIIEVEDCLTRKIIYSYEMSQKDSSNLVPCGLRPQPLGCYSLFFTNLESNIIIDNKESKPEKKNYLGAKIAIGALILLLAFFLLMRKQSKTEIEDVQSKETYIVQVGKYTFDTNNLILSLEDSKEELTSKESDLLLLLLSSVNETIEREEILKAVWGDEGDYIGRTLDVFISKLRKRLQGDENIKIMNVRGVGYKLIINTP